MAEQPGNGTNAEIEGRYEGPRAHEGPGQDEHDDPAYVTRTKFLTGVAIATGGVMSAAILVPVIGFAVVDPLRPEEFRWIDVGPLSDFVANAPPYDTSGGTTPVVGKSTSIAVSGPAPESDRRAFVVFEQSRAKKEGKVDVATLTAEDMEIVVIWNRCSHLGCPVTSGGGAFVCPCHGGAYDSRGHVVSGPPPRPLDRFDWKITDGTNDVELVDALETPNEKHRLLIGKPYSIDSDEKPFKIKLPGEPVEGILANLYPF